MEKGTVPPFHGEFCATQVLQKVGGVHQWAVRHRDEGDVEEGAEVPEVNGMRGRFLIPLFDRKKMEKGTVPPFHGEFCATQVLQKVGAFIGAQFDTETKAMSKKGRKYLK